MFREKQLEAVLKNQKKEVPNEFAKFTLPMVRRVFASSIANTIVSVQPMLMPSGNIFYMDQTYGNVIWKKLRKAGLKRKGR